MELRDLIIDYQTNPSDRNFNLIVGAFKPQLAIIAKRNQGYFSTAECYTFALTGLWNGVRNYDSSRPHSPKTYLFRYADGEVRQQYRSKYNIEHRLLFKPLDYEGKLDVDPVDLIHNKEIYATYKAANLTPRQRQYINMYLCEDAGYTNISKRHKVTKQAVVCGIRFGLKKLQRGFMEAGYE